MTHIADIDAADGWLVHPQAWHDGRKFGIGGSDAVVIMRGIAEEVEALRLQKINGTAAGRGLSLGASAVDLSRVLPVQMGSWTEPLNRLWLSYAIGQPVHPGTSVLHQSISFMRASLDGIVGAHPSEPHVGVNPIVECKHVNDFSKFEGVLSKYYAQLQHNIVVTMAPCCYLSVFFGSGRHEWKKIDPDFPYIEKLLCAERNFWDHVINEIPFTADVPPIAFVPLDKMRQVDMSESNSWAELAALWLADRPHARAFDETTAQLKNKMESDVRRAYGAGIEVTRDKRGITVRALVSETFSLKRSPQTGEAA